MDSFEELFRKPITCANAGDMLHLVREGIEDTATNLSEWRIFLKTHPNASIMRMRIKEHRDKAVKELRALRRREATCLRLAA